MKGDVENGYYFNISLFISFFPLIIMASGKIVTLNVHNITFFRLKSWSEINLTCRKCQPRQNISGN